jgi:hypothetical protein
VGHAAADGEPTVTSAAFLAALRAHCPLCGHTMAWHIDGRCAYQLRPGRQGGWYAPRREAHFCGCPGEARDAD